MCFAVIYPISPSLRGASFSMWLHSFTDAPFLPDPAVEDSKKMHPPPSPLSPLFSLFDFCCFCHVHIFLVVFFLVTIYLG
ncbi:hypothetical protein PRIPAC_71244 [Pristionchus pacificus]|uniref:Uncharacterized protein n=1 Tax=Pristionchus pacificus TaxID=54126 RepID=A0A2A6CAF9_PRIPA|nr:hypothetical protein PRIPAC_71244 [Pristionchus pacificus]|eukprot:PDM75058.1 hypothetical protein PRIPAC_40439 [Pristionchus pacificus]